MAIEPKRGCGFRRAGGLYLVSGKLSAPCCRLPLPLTVCPTCSEGIKQTRGWRWVEPKPLFAKAPQPCSLDSSFRDAASRHLLCPLSRFSPQGIFNDQRCGLLWVGASFYATPEHFTAEAAMLGVSKRIASIPSAFVLAETWVLLAHPFACRDRETGKLAPGVFAVFRPQRVEKLVKRSEAAPEVLAALQARGITPVIVPDEDRDHCADARRNLDAEFDYGEA